MLSYCQFYQNCQVWRDRWRVKWSNEVVMFVPLESLIRFRKSLPSKNLKKINRKKTRKSWELKSSCRKTEASWTPREKSSWSQQVHLPEFNLLYFTVTWIWDVERTTSAEVACTRLLALSTRFSPSPSCTRTCMIARGQDYPQSSPFHGLY